MKHILLVEDSNLFGSVMTKELVEHLKCKVEWAKSYLEAQALLKENSLLVKLNELSSGIPT